MFLLLRLNMEWVVVVHTFNLCSTQEAQTGASLSLRTAMNYTKKTKYQSFWLLIRSRASRGPSSKIYANLKHFLSSSILDKNIQQSQPWGHECRRTGPALHSLLLGWTSQGDAGERSWWWGRRSGLLEQSADPKLRISAIQGNSRVSKDTGDNHN